MSDAARSRPADPGADRVVRTSSGLPIDPVYVPAPPGSPEPPERIGYPGEYPFTRGLHPNGYRGRLWTMRQYAGYATAEETNRRYRFLLSRGQTGLSVAFDLPTQMGFDSDHPMAEGEVGKSGVAISSVEDMDGLLDGIPLDQVTISMTINSTAAILLGMLCVTAERRGTAWSSLGGTVQNDLLKEYIARGTYIYPPQPSMRLTVDLFEFCARHVPKWNTISISGYHIREAGATAAQELGFTLANAIAYLEAARQRGLAVDAVGERVSFFFNGHNRFFEEVAKFRAARRMWARIMKERFGAADPRAMMLRFHTQTAGSTLTAVQPENNVIRVALQAMAAVLGGTQSLHTNSRDEALCLPTEESAKLALRTQQILAAETGVADTVDPLAGSYFVEDLTDRLEAAATAILDKVDALGGPVAAIEQGWFQAEIERSAYEAQRRIEADEEVVVGVNRYVEAGDRPERPEILKVDPSIREERARRLAELRARRDSAAVDGARRGLAAAARGTGNLVPPILDALRAGTTLGEISDTLRDVFGVHRPGIRGTP